MQLIDTHCHLYGNQFKSDLPEVIQRAEQEGVVKFFLPAIDRASMSEMLAVEERFRGKCVAMMGLHPCSVHADYEEELKIVEDLLARRPFAAVGEIGLDFYWDRSFETQQYDALHRQIEWALHYDLPIVLHSRESMVQTIDVVREHQNGRLGGIFHCFSGSVELAQQVIDLGFYLGIGGVLTYKNGGLDETLRHVSLDHIVLETDAPYLAPVPFRGKRNESSYLKYVVARLADIKDVSVDEVARITTANAQKIFGQ